MDAALNNVNAQDFLSSVPDGCFNAISSYMVLDDYESLHHVIHKNKQCEPHWLTNLRKYAQRAEPLYVSKVPALCNLYQEDRCAGLGAAIVPQGSL